MKRFFIALSFTALLLLLPAQDAAAQVGFGLKGGLLWSDFRGDVDDPETSFGRRSSFSGGLYAQLGFGGIVIQPELLYVKRGATVNAVVDTESVQVARFDLTYLEVPVLLRFGSKPNFFIGPYGAIRTKSTVIDTEVEEAAEIDIGSSVQNLDYGLVFGIGVDLGTLGLEARYTMGLRNLFTAQTGETAPDAKHRGIALFATIGF